METKRINIPPSFGELEQLTDEELQKLIRMASAVLSEKTPSSVTPSTTGRTSNIAQAFRLLPSAPVNAEEFAAQHGISVSTLRQQKRFDPLQGEGMPRVYVKKSRKDGVLYIWRGDPNALK